MPKTNPSESEAELVAGIGHNKPPLEEVLKDQFKSDMAEVEKLAEQANALKKSIENDDDLIPYTQVVKGTRALLKSIDDKRKKETEAYRAAEKTTNDFFRPMTARLERIKSVLEDRATAYNAEKEERERRRLAEIAEQERKEQEALRKEAEEAVAAGRHVEAEVIEQQAEQKAARAEGAAQQATSGSAADLTRTRTEAGTVTSVGTWTFQIEDVTKIPLAQLRNYLELAHIEKALKAYAKANQDKKPLAGVRFFKTSKASFR
jgi:hypothetical protein